MARDINELDSFPKVDGGWRIRSTERFYVDVLLMGYNYRIVTRRLVLPAPARPGGGGAARLRLRPGRR
jgi:hypothetical protein